MSPRRAVPASRLAASLLLLATVALLSPGAAAAQRTDVYIFDLTDQGRLVTRVTDRAGYDNQPAFGPDGRSLLFTSDRAGGQMDIFRYDLEGGVLTNLTRTPDRNEFSGKPWGDDAFSFVLQEGSPYQNVWRQSLAGSEPERVLTSYIPAGYYAVNEAGVLFWGRYAYSLFFEPAGAEVGPANGESLFVTGQAGTSIHPVPGTRRFSFVHHEANGTSVVKSLDPETGSMTPITAIPGENEEHCWTPEGTLLAARGTTLHRFVPGGEEGWQPVAELEAPGLERLSRCAVSPDGRYVAFVNTAGG